MLSPRPLRHPYLLYASTLIVASQLAASDLLAPYLLSLGPAPPAGSSRSAAAAASREKQKEREKRAAAARVRMEASYEVLGTGSDAHSEASNGEEVEAEERDVNGEEVRADVEVFLKKQIVRSTLTGLGFLLSIVGIWGDGVSPIYGQAVVVEF